MEWDEMVEMEEREVETLEKMVEGVVDRVVERLWLGWNS